MDIIPIGTRVRVIFGNYTGTVIASNIELGIYGTTSAIVRLDEPDNTLLNCVALPHAWLKEIV